MSDLFKILSLIPDELGQVKMYCQLKHNHHALVMFENWERLKGELAAWQEANKEQEFVVKQQATTGAEDTIDE